MSNVNVADITFHSPDKSRIEWLHEKFVQSQGFCVPNPKDFKEYWEDRIQLVKFAEFMNMPELSDADGRSEVCDVKDIFEKNGEYAFEIYTFNPWNAPYDFWKRFSEDMDVEYAMIDEVDGEISITNDPEAIWYPERCKIDYWEDEEKVFNKIEDMVEYLKDHHSNIAPLNLDDTDEWNEALRDEDIGAVRVYDREGAVA